jgi:hypothetical protein
MRTTRTRGWFAVLAATAVGALLAATEVRAQTCGDPNGDGLDIIDAANVLRAAVGLPSTCAGIPQACNVDGGAAIDVVDAARVLRVAVGLSAAELECPLPEITDFVNDVEVPGGAQGTLTLGIAPIPQAGAPATIASVEGGGQAEPGGTNAVTVNFAGGAAAAAAASDPGLVVAVRKADATLAEGFFDLAVPAIAGSITVVLSFPDTLGPGPFAVVFATRAQGVLGAFVELPQVTSAQPTPNAKTPTPRRTPFCGNNIIELGETCDGTNRRRCDGCACRRLTCRCDFNNCGD